MEWTGGGSIIGEGWTEVSLALWHMRSDLEAGRATIHPTLQEAEYRSGGQPCRTLALAKKEISLDISDSLVGGKLRC